MAQLVYTLSRRHDSDSYVSELPVRITFFPAGGSEAYDYTKLEIATYRYALTPSGYMRYTHWIDITGCPSIEDDLAHEYHNGPLFEAMDLEWRKRDVREVEKA